MASPTDPEVKYTEPVPVRIYSGEILLTLESSVSDDIQVITDRFICNGLTILSGPAFYKNPKNHFRYRAEFFCAAFGSPPQGFRIDTKQPFVYFGEAGEPQTVSAVLVPV